jgi:GTP-binding protein
MLVDLKVGATADDINMFAYMDNFKIPYIIVATKSDKLNKTQKEEKFDELKNAYSGYTVIMFSSLSGEGTDEIRRSIFNYMM